MTKPLRSSLTTIVLAAVIGGGVFAATAAQAGGRDSSHPREIVSYNDLDIGTVEGAKTLYGRIHRASAKVCRHYHPPHHLGGAMAHYRCRQELVDITVDDVKSPMLSAIHENRSVQFAAND